MTDETDDGALGPSSVEHGAPEVERAGGSSERLDASGEGAAATPEPSYAPGERAVTSAVPAGARPAQPGHPAAGAARTRRTRKWVLGAAAIVALTAVGLFALGRIAICECGYVSLWHSAPADSGTSQHLSDPYSFSHVLHGFGFFWILWLLARRLSPGARGLLAIAAECGWELLENTPIIIDRYRDNTSSLDYFGDTVVNSMGDIAAMMLGYWLAARLSFRFVLAITIAVELILLVAIRDNLVLNVLMLLYPIEAIKRWQLGG